MLTLYNRARLYTLWIHVYHLRLVFIMSNSDEAKKLVAKQRIFQDTRILSQNGKWNKNRCCAWKNNFSELISAMRDSERWLYVAAFYEHSLPLAQIFQAGRPAIGQRLVDFIALVADRWGQK